MVANVENALRDIQEIPGARIRLRRFTEQDAPAVLAYGSDPETLRHLFWDGISDIEGALESIRGYFQEIPGAFAIELDGDCIGCIELRLLPEHERAEAAYVLNRAHWGQGYMSEALRLLLNVAFGVLELQSVFAKHDVNNPASGRVMEKCGMRHEGTLRDEVKIRGKFLTMAHYSILRSEHVL